MIKYMSRVLVVVCALVSFMVFFGVKAMAIGPAGEYSGRLSSVQGQYGPENGDILNSSGTVYNTVNDHWTKFSSNTADAATNKTALNVRVSTAQAIPVAVNPGVALSVDIRGSSNTVEFDNTGAANMIKIDGTSNTVIIDPTEPVRCKIDGSSNTVIVDPTQSVRIGIIASSNTIKIDGSSNTVTLSNSGSDNMIKIDGTSNTVIIDPTQSVRVGIIASSNTIKIDGSSNTVKFDITGANNMIKVDGSSNVVRIEDATFYTHTSTAMVVYPEENDRIDLNAVGTGYTANYDHDGVVTTTGVLITTSWGGEFHIAPGHSESISFQVPTATAPWVNVGLGPQGTFYFTLNGKRDTR